MTKLIERVAHGAVGSFAGRVLTVLSVVVLLGCGPVPAQDTSMVVSSDPELASAVAALLPELAERAGLPLLRPVRVERRSRGELERYLRFRLERELPEEEARDIVRSYYHLGMVPEDLDLRDLLMNVYTEQVAGFYDPDSTALFVMDDQPAGGMEALLVHELVHAVQDQHSPLDSLTAKEHGNDRRAAAHAAIEGHAMLVMLEYMTEQLQGSPVDLSQLADFAETSRPMLAAMADVYPILAGAPRVVRESLLFPYIEGAGFVHALWRAEEGRPPPLGPFLPRSTRQVLDPAPALEAGLPSPMEVALTPPAGSRILYTNDLGRLEAGILLEERGLGRGAASGLSTDRFALLETGDGGAGVIWVSVWDDEVGRDRFLGAVRPALGTFPVPSTIEVVDADGAPGLLLRTGAAREGTVTVRIVGGAS